jgi:hypothetical protein
MIYTNYFYFIKINIYLVQEMLLVEDGGGGNECLRIKKMRFWEIERLKEIFDNND